MNQPIFNPKERRVIPEPLRDAPLKNTREQETSVSQTEIREMAEQTKETLPASADKEGFLDETIDSLKRTLRQSKKKPPAIPQIRDEITRNIEHIMEEGLADAYQALSPVQQQEFKIKGEQTAIHIRHLLRASKIKVKKIFRLILEWLKLLPGINKFFLEQEAKIKADKIISLHRQQKP